MGEVFRRRAKGLSDDAKKWYGLAAAQNHVYALMRLGDDDSLKKARELAQAEADKGNADAMLALYELDQDIATLKKAADAGSMEAQYILAIKYEEDETLIVDKAERDIAIDGLLKKAAASGFSRAMHWCANRPPILWDLPVRRQWVEKRAQRNDVYGLLNYGRALGGFYTAEDGADEYGFTEDLVKSYGLFWLITETTRELSVHALAAQDLQTIAKDMTTAQIDAAPAVGSRSSANVRVQADLQLGQMIGPGQRHHAASVTANARLDCVNTRLIDGHHRGRII
ncbi:sel1 repeat family protein [Pseudomonas laurylsulfatiphila]|uniref:sel1 repeat family protein n=1 Tax=Pseudomonas laurylsulfatiphila TaxID=2011015 RepID=UPI001F0BD053|nr:sel1 repeat family protein [Pseudomonas laurylsulfatiphila]